MTTKESGLISVIKLVERFNEKVAIYKANKYSEAHTREDFINPFFEALGWDIGNLQEFTESYREVYHEDKVEIGAVLKSPDYSFRIGGNRVFFVEAKKPSIDVKDNISSAFQVRRYGWSAKLKVSIITDFEEFAIYDCTKKPNEKDKASVARVKYFTFNDYEKEWDFLWNTFSKEAILKGKFDNFTTQNLTKKGTETVDSEFLISLDQWRTLLAETISEDNLSLNEDELNFAVQQTLDRFIFLRIAEDRFIEPYGSLQKCLKKGNYFKYILELFNDADKKYNSGLFDLKNDKVSKTLNVSNDTLESIINSLYYPESPYAFSVISVEILGSAYEQFLGKTITINRQGKAVIEFKPDVRKAGGVYYTPQYVVNYIVENTIGNLIKNKTPKEVEDIKIADPACGSGSFLLGAYQYLLKWHREYYLKNPYKKNILTKNPLTPEGNLTTSEKKKILLNNIYGVDIDTNAVEVSKLSLLLKCMEGETSASIKDQLDIFHERVLPTLDSNIRSGNSLIDTDFYEYRLPLGEERKVKPFNWETEFPKVFDNKGFDVIIGNPPYLKLTANNEEPEILKYYKDNYSSYSGGSSKNLFQLFLEKVKALNPKTFSFIIPESLLTTDSNGKIRELLSENFNITSIVTFDHFVFQDATIGTTIIVGDKGKPAKTKIFKIDTSHAEKFIEEKVFKGLGKWEVETDTKSQVICNKLDTGSTPMGSLVSMSKGMVVKDRNEVLTEKETKNSYPFLLGNCMSRYFYKYDKYAVYEKLEIIGGTRDFTKQLSIPRLLIRRTGATLCATYSDKKELIESTIYILRSSEINIKYLLGLINSKVFTYYLTKKLLTNQQGFPQVLMGQLEQLPVKNSPKNKIEQGKIIDYVEQLKTQ